MQREHKNLFNSSPSCQAFHLLLLEMKTLRHYDIREALSPQYQKGTSFSFQAVNKWNICQWQHF